jgi:uncharacterized protein (TIGR03435 family)
MGRTVAAAISAGLLSLFTAPAPAAQERPPVGNAPRFDVASVKPHGPTDDVMFALEFHEGGRLTATGTLRMLIRTAYRLQDFQLVAGSGWMDDERFDVDARAARNAPPDEMRVMLRELLRERFGLTLRQERRDVPVYALRTTARRGFGRRLSRPPEDCATRAQAPGTAVAPANSKGEPLACGFRLAPGGLSARGVTMAMLANELSMWADRIVTDQTGLDGEFDVDLDWTSDRLPPAPAFLSTPDLVAAPVEPDWPSLFTAINDQLGLTLEPDRGNAEVLVIDRADYPSAN